MPVAIHLFSRKSFCTKRNCTSWHTKLKLYINRHVFYIVEAIRVHQRILNPYHLSKLAPNDVFSVFMDSTFRSPLSCAAVARVRESCTLAFQSDRPWSPDSASPHLPFVVVSNTLPKTRQMPPVLPLRDTTTITITKQRNKRNTSTRALARAKHVLFMNAVAKSVIILLRRLRFGNTRWRLHRHSKRYVFWRRRRRWRRIRFCVAFFVNRFKISTLPSSPTAHYRCGLAPPWKQPERTLAPSITVVKDEHRWAAFGR